jgi:hypothetical protein
VRRFLHSHSAHEAFDECPARFKLLQDRAEQGPAPENRLFGIAFHKFCEKYVSHCVDTHRWSDVEAAPRFLDETIRECWISTKYFDELKLFADQFVANYRIDPVRSVARERGVAFDEALRPVEWTEDLEYDSPNFRRQPNPAIFRTKHDHIMLEVEDHVLIVDDFKTDRYVPSQTVVEDPATRWWKQARLAAWSARARFYPPAVAVKFRFVFVRWTKPGGGFIQREITLSPNDLDQYEQIFLSRVGYIEATEHFPAIPREHCRSCPFLETECPIAARASMQLNEPEEIAGVYLQTAALQELRREELKTVTERTGPITIGGVDVGLFERSEKKVLDVQKTLDALVAEGFEREGACLLLDVSATKLKEVLDPDQVKRVLEAASTSEAGVVFNVHQNKPRLIELAKRYGIEKPDKMTVAQLAQKLATIAPKKEVA